MQSHRDLLARVTSPHHTSTFQMSPRVAGVSPLSFSFIFRQVFLALEPRLGILSSGRVGYFQQATDIDLLLQIRAGRGVEPWQQNALGLQGGLGRESKSNEPSRQQQRSWRTTRAPGGRAGACAPRAGQAGQRNALRKASCALSVALETRAARRSIRPGRSASRPLSN